MDTWTKRGRSVKVGRPQKRERKEIAKMKNKIGLLIGLFLLLIFSSVHTSHGEQAETGDTSFSKIKEKGKLIAGSSPWDTPPMSYFEENGNIVGLEIDVIREIASQLGLEAEVRYTEWDVLFDQIKTGELDVAVASITITIERQKEMLFSDPYFSTGQVALVKSDYDGINSPEDLAGRVVAAESETTCERAALSYVDESTLIKYITQEDMDGILESMLNGKVDAIVMDYIGAWAYTLEGKYKIATEPFTQEYYGFATKLGNKALMEKINGVLRKMKRTGKLNEINAKWLNK